MPRFFVEDVAENEVVIDGENANHITKSLRMRVGETLTLCDMDKMEYECEIIDFVTDGVVVKVNEKNLSQREASVKVTLYQGVTKGDKMDSIVQKSVEVGVSEIVPILTTRCISRPDDKSSKKKQQRWQKIALEAAKQSQRAVVPNIKSITNFKEAVEKDKSDLKILFYENGGISLKKELENEVKSISIFIGPEGGWDEKEVEFASGFGVKTATLGARILRTETAPIVALTAIMFATGNMD